MTEQTTTDQILAGGDALPRVTPGDEFAAQIADQVESFLIAVREIAGRGRPPDRSISLLLLEISQMLLAGARLGAQVDFTPEDEFEPDAGPDPDLDALRLRLANLLEDIDDYSDVFDPYDPEQVDASSPTTSPSIASDLAHGLHHFRARQHRRGAVVVAVLLRLLVGHPRARCSAPCCRWSPTTASTWRSPVSSTRSPRRMRCRRARPRTPSRIGAVSAQRRARAS